MQHSGWNVSSIDVSLRYICDMSDILLLYMYVRYLGEMKDEFTKKDVITAEAAKQRISNELMITI